MNLSGFKSCDFDRGRAVWVEALWLLLQALFINCWLPGSAHRKLLLRVFGAKIGLGVVLKPYLRVKFPWRLTIGDHSWVGESVWIDNLASIQIGKQVCISQAAYLCTGSHDWSAPKFDLRVSPIQVDDHAWVGARTTLAPGTHVGEGAVVSLAALASGTLVPWQIYQGAPAVAVKQREIGSDLP